MIELKSDNKAEQSSVYLIIQLSYTIYWTMIGLKSIDESEQSSVNILSHFWIESDNRSSHRFWILNFIYQNYTTSTLYHHIWLPSSGVQTWHLCNMAPFFGNWTMLIFHKQHNLTDWSSKKLNVIVRCINHLQLNTLHYALRIRFCTNDSCHWPFVFPNVFI